jgi:probable F420-dependent oxidoreductase
VAHDRRFRFGIHSSDAASGAAWAARARQCEEIGVSTLFLRDHFDQQLAPIVAMTAAACATSTLRVGCLVLDNDYRHPLVLAKELATLDFVSDGRVEIGLGAGWMAPDYEQAGMQFDPPGVRVTRLIEAVRVMKALFEDDKASFAGEHYTITGHQQYPPSVQRPRPPILIAGGGPRLLRFASREADIIGLNPARVSNAAWDDQNLADATAEAMDRKAALIRDAAGDRYDDLELQIVVPFVVVTDDREGTAAAIAAGLPADAAVEITPAAVLSSPYVLIGSESQICDTIIERRDRWGFSYYVFNDDSIEAVTPIVARLAGR